ncbi:outer membrane beta-barrel protein [Ekhidna sp.]|jgi:hypothetical protein|uniref:outer membrane beta-barrel protein n=1 Tax=Ekhidna sp. TaxID=2608089 RepID=UPI0032EE2D37
MKILWLICTACLMHVGVAQKIYVGAKAGGHASSAFIEHTIFNTTMNTTFLPGVNGGVFVRYLPKAGDSFLNSGIQLGVNYVQKGWKQIFLDIENLPAYTARMNYLEIPLEGIGYFGGKNKYFISAGLHLEFLISTDLDSEPVEDNLISDFYTYESSRDREVGYGARLAGGLFREMSIGTVQVEGFFSYSFSNFIDAGDLTTETPDISNHWVVGFTVGYMVAFGRNQENEME